MRLCLSGLVEALAVLAFAGCGSSDSSTSTPSDDEFAFESAEGGSEGDTEHWAEVWCQINGSMTCEDTIEMMGEPTEEFDASKGQPQSQWDAGSFGYTLFYDNTGHAEQAYVNELELSKADKPFPLRTSPLLLVRMCVHWLTD
jgi:hypothetical protein